MNKDEYPETLQAALTGVGNRLLSDFAEAESDRNQTELRWLKDLRQYKGKYEDSFVKNLDEKQSRVFVKETRKKCKSIDAYLRDMLFPPNSDKNWGLDPSPEPELHPVDMRDVERVAAIHAEQGKEFDKKALIKEIAKERCDNMITRISDQLVDMRYSEIVGHDVIHSATVYGTGVLKGPLVESRSKVSWVVGEDGVWESRSVEEYQPYSEFVSLWGLYPDMSATNPKDVRYIFQRHVMQKRDVVELAKRNDFDGEIILEYLRAVSQGDVSRKNHEVQLNNMGTSASVRSDEYNKYELIEFWGSLSASELRQCGCDDIDEDDQSEYWGNVWMLGHFVIKAELSPFESNKHPYHFFYFDKDETSIFGEGIPALLRDDQEMLNAATRAMLDNAAITAGPQFDVNLDLLDPLEDPTDIYPLKAWLRHGEGIESQYPAVREMRLSSYTNEYLALIQKAEQWGSEHTVPSYMHGMNDPRGAAGTMGGLSMLMGAANIEIKDLARNFDNGITMPFIRAMFEWNMEMSEDESIKGDFSVKARGSSSLVAKEIRAQQLDQFAASVSNQLDSPFVKRAELLRRRAEAHDIGENIIKTDKEVKTEQQGQSQSPAVMAAMREAEAKIRNMDADTKLKEGKSLLDRVKALGEQLDAAIKAGGDIQTMISIYQELNSVLDTDEEREETMHGDNHGFAGEQYNGGMAGVAAMSP